MIPRREGEDGGENSLAGERVHGLPNITREEVKEAKVARRVGEAEELGTEEILRHIYEANYNQVVMNDGAFPPVNNNTVVIVVQVHNRITYLRYPVTLVTLVTLVTPVTLLNLVTQHLHHRQLVASLKLARGIQDTLLVFSHDVWDPEINALVRWIHA